MPVERNSLRIVCVGTGDAFGSGGRLNSCYHFNHSGEQVLLDCGCSSLIGMQRCDLDPADISAVMVSHLHGDHFGGIPFLLLEAKYVSKRTRPLILAGPAGLQQRVETALETLYPGTLDDGLAFPVEYRTLKSGEPLKIGRYTVTPRQVRHGRSPDVFGLRVEIGDKVVSYTGDTEWTEELIPLAQASDLLIAECFAYDQPISSHLDYLTLRRQRGELSCRRLVLTHPGPEILARRDQLDFELLNDGALLELT